MSDLVEAVNCDKPEFVVAAEEYILGSGSFVVADYDGGLAGVYSSFDDLQEFDGTSEDAFAVVLDVEAELVVEPGDEFVEFVVEAECGLAVEADDEQLVLDDEFVELDGEWVVVDDNNAELVGDIHV